MILKEEHLLRDLLGDHHKKIDSEVLKIMLPELEEKTMHLVQEAKKIMRHSKRKVLKPSDIDLALKMLEKNIEFSAPLAQIMGSAPFEFEKRITEENTQWTVKNEDLNLMQFLNKPIIETPLKIGLEMHWALINGEMPIVSENILPPKEKRNLKKKEEDPFTHSLLPKEPSIKKKLRMEFKKELSVTKEVMEFYSKFLEIFQVEENENIQTLSQRTSLEISSQLTMYIDLISKEPSIVDVVPAIFDFIYKKTIDYITSKTCGDAKMMFICMTITKQLLSNPFYNCEEKIHAFIDLLYDTLIRQEYTEESLDKCADIIMKSKSISAEALNLIILEYGTKYQSIIKSIFDCVKAQLQKEDRSYLLLYGPLYFVSLQDLYHSTDCLFYTKYLKEILKEVKGEAFKEPCLEIIKRIITNLIKFLKLDTGDKQTIEENEVKEILALLYEYFPDYVHQDDYSLEMA
ncbi:unnamed protein product [Moneuplotes crassus]|uniref:TATA box binding protein associated factor (TAF) histone-like fold domain-containing protein n=2 Tax=Euplotes crassus TaxID=5936 RepID=A0AAD1UG13_EUPCR|nr:unnamed protein product [Moneuplotes crassus]